MSTRSTGMQNRYIVLCFCSCWVDAGVYVHAYFMYVHAYFIYKSSTMRMYGHSTVHRYSHSTDTNMNLQIQTFYIFAMGILT